MIYSPDINKICALCQHSSAVKGDAEHLKCSVRACYMPIDGTCDEFLYDIFKKPTRRRRRLKNKFSAEDFSL